MPLKCPDRLERSLQVDGEDLGNEFRRALLERGLSKNLRRRNEDVDSAETAHGCLNEAVQVVDLRHIALDNEHARRRHRGQFIEPAAVSAKYDDLRPFPEKPLNDGPPEHPAGARHHRHLVQQTLSHPGIIEWRVASGEW